MLVQPLSSILTPKRIPSKFLKPREPRLWALEVVPSQVYVAASMSNQEAALRFAIGLQDAGFVVVSRWLRHDFSDKPDPLDWVRFVEYEEEWGRQDLEDLSRSDTLVVLADKPSSSGGFHLELGYFMGAKKSNIVVVGDRPNVFYWTEDVRWAPSTLGLIDWLRSLGHGKNTQGLTGTSSFSTSTTSIGVEAPPDCSRTTLPEYKEEDAPF